jgi:hypothetical protein
MPPRQILNGTAAARRSTAATSPMRSNDGRLSCSTPSPQWHCTAFYHGCCPDLGGNPIYRVVLVYGNSVRQQWAASGPASPMPTICWLAQRWDGSLHICICQLYISHILFIDRPSPRKHSQTCCTLNVGTRDIIATAATLNPKCRMNR